MMNTEFNIKGHSGCDIKIKKNRVIKIASDRKYSNLKMKMLQHLKFTQMVMMMVVFGLRWR